MWKDESGYTEPDKERMCHCCANVGVEDIILETEYWYYCKSAIKRFEGKICEPTATPYNKDTEIKRKYEVCRQGVCRFFKKIPQRCPDYNTHLCKRKNCRKEGYDNNCMEIVKEGL